MRRYGIARYLTAEQRERAARATYRSFEVSNACERGCCFERGDSVMATRTVVGGHCPLGVAFDVRALPMPEDMEYELSKTGRNARIRKAAARFIHDVDSGRIGPDDVAAALGVEVER